MKIKVESKHIELGKQGFSMECAVALALKEQYPDFHPNNFYVCGSGVYDTAEEKQYLKFPPEATMFISQFDLNKDKVKPIEFTCILVE